MTNLYFRNSYKCSCGETWEDEWDSMCDDRCPECNTSTSPYISNETGLTLALYAALDMYNDRWQEVNSYGDQDTADNCDRWADECSTIKHSYSDFSSADEFSELETDFRKKAEELRAESYGD